ncbi:MAG: ABC transporter permease [Phycisphaerae bacterium]|nr:ABC transporter permease [Phycisphaerae bacterium]
MKRVLAIARLTFSEGIRMRIVVVFLIVLGFLVLRLPFAMSGDGTLAGRLQSFLDYSLAAVSLLLSLTTVMLSCATLANEFKAKSLQMVVTKPVSRFQILLGKWIGVNMLVVLMLGLCGGAIYGFAWWIARQPELAGTADHLKVRDVVWTARQSARAVRPDFLPEAIEYVRGRIEEGAIPTASERTEIEHRVRQLETQWRTIGAQQNKVYEFENLPPPLFEGQFVQVKFKVRASPIPPDEIAALHWWFLDPETGAPLGDRPLETRERTWTSHQFLVDTRVIRNGRASLFVRNLAPYESDIAVTFENEVPLQILYTVSSFEQNYLKALALMFLRLSFLSALGVFFGTFVSFPVACFCGLTWYLICLGRPFWMESIGANMTMRIADMDPYGSLGPVIRWFLVPFMRVMFPDFSLYSGNQYLVDGLHISGQLVGEAFLHTLALGGLLLLVVGWLIFREREVAEVTV